MVTRLNYKGVIAESFRVDVLDQKTSQADKFPLSRSSIAFIFRAALEEIFSSVNEDKGRGPLTKQIFWKALKSPNRLDVY